LGASAKYAHAQYDEAGNRITFIYQTAGANTVTLAHHYDPLNRATAIERNDTDLIAYDYQGRDLTRRRITTEYRQVASAVADGYIDYQPEYDDHRRITKISNIARNSLNSETEHPLAVYTYGYDQAGNRLSHNGTIGKFSVWGRKVTYAYDRLHRVIRAAYTAPSGVTTDFEYDLPLTRRVSRRETHRFAMMGLRP